MKGVVREEDNGTFTARVYLYDWRVHVESNHTSTFGAKVDVRRAVGKLTEEPIEFYSIGRKA